MRQMNSRNGYATMTALQTLIYIAL